MQVFVTPRAERNFDSIVDYINKNGEKGQLKNLFKKLMKFLNSLQIIHKWGKLKRATLEDFNFHLR